MKRLPRSRTQRGLTLIEILVWVGILAAVGVFAATQFADIRATQRTEQAFQEITRLVGAAASYRAAPANAGSYENISVTRLVDRGYIGSGYSDGANENAFGLTVSVASANSHGDATVTYATGNADQTECLQLVDRFTDMTGVKGDPSCTTGTLTLTLE